MIKVGVGGISSEIRDTSETYKFTKILSVSELIGMTGKHVRKTIEDLEDLDVVFWKLGGADPNAFIWKLRISGCLNAFVNRSYFCAIWSMDSHHMHRAESKSQQFFDHVFVAHSPYLEYFDSTTSSHLPCSFPAELPAGLAFEGYAVQSASAGSVTSVFALYPGQIRNHKFFQIAQILDRNNVDYFFGSVRGGGTLHGGMLNHLAQHKIIVNLSLQDDLNIRNFEGLALNKILLTNQVHDHSILQDYSSNIVFFKRDLSDFEQKLQEALSLAPQDISRDFIEQHGLAIRLQNALRVCTRFITEGANNPKISIKDTIGSNYVSEVISQQFSALQLSSSSIEGIFSTATWRLALKTKGLAGLRTLLSGWIRSVLFLFAKRTFGGMSLIRVLKACSTSRFIGLVKNF
jgi:hypothetical protein